MPRKKQAEAKDKKPQITFHRGTGRRKLSIARVRLMQGSGQIIINKRSFEEYFPSQITRNSVMMPLQVTSSANKFDIFVSVYGGGISGQAGAVTLGIARALVELDSNNRSELKRKGLLTRDPRMIERKKYGYKKARKKPQFSKR